MAAVAVLCYVSVAAGRRVLLLKFVYNHYIVVVRNIYIYIYIIELRKVERGRR